MQLVSSSSNPNPNAILRKYESQLSAPEVDALVALDWEHIETHLASFLLTDLGRDALQTTPLFLDSLDAIQHGIKEVCETRWLIQHYGHITLDACPDGRRILQRLAKQGELVSPQEAAELLACLKALRQLARFFISNRDTQETTTLCLLTDTITLPNTAIEALEAIIQDDGQWQPNASVAYATLTEKRFKQRQGIKEHLTRMMSRPPMNKYVQEAIVTERDGRYVLPIKIEHKADVPGVSHGVSSSGWTVYMEPKSVVEQNNTLISVESQLEQEIQRLLKHLSQTLQPLADDALGFCEVAGSLDILYAKARQAIALDSYPINLYLNENNSTSTDPRIDLQIAKHPLLILQGIEVVPNTVTLTSEQRMMVITGPNTGGKTVVLKLVGLLSLMTRAGLPVPAQPESSLMLFPAILADIGDSQNIAQNLSTFSGHINHIQDFLAHPKLGESLVILDEICAGTDPEEGTALAKAILSEFQEAGATVLVSTHLGALKQLAYDDPQVCNAAVAFDNESLKPLYKLQLGMSGTSQALHIASTLGLSPDIIARAQHNLTQQPTSTWHLMSTLETQSQEVTQALEASMAAKADAEAKQAQVQSKLNEVEEEKRRTLAMFRQRLQDRLRKVEHQLEDLRKTLRDPKAVPTHKALAHMEGRLAQALDRGEMVLDEEESLVQPTPGLSWSDIHVGDKVKCRNNTLSGEVVEKIESKKAVIIQSGILKSTVPIEDIIEKLDQMVLTKKQKHQKEKKQHVTQSQVTRSDTRASEHRGLSLHCDVRGLQQLDALGVIDKVLDEALLENIPQVDIVHGLGTGALKKAIREYVMEMPFVKRYEAASAMDGGDGKTIVYLR